MVYTAQPNQLPTITQVLQMVNEMTSRVPVRHRMPYDEPVAGDDLFLLNRTASGLFTLKPNITTQPCLFYGDNEYHLVLQPKWNSLQPKDYLIENVMREEFELTMMSHPLYRLFVKGIPTRRQPVRIINPFGVAMSYGFPSPMLPLTSSLDVASFLATHRRNEQTGEWEAIEEYDSQGNINVGVLYVLDLALPFPMMVGLSCVGMQAFERPGRQKSYGLHIEKGGNFNEYRFVYGFQFRQNPEDVRCLEEKFEKGNWLTPDELIAQKAQDILRTKRVSEAAFQLNCRNNPSQNPEENRSKLEKAGVQILNSSGHTFSDEELNREFYPHAEEKWEEMFNSVVAVHPGFDTLLTDIRNFPTTAMGRNFFRK